MWIFTKRRDLTAYVEQHEFCFDAVLDEDVSNDEVLLFSCLTHIPEQHSVIILKNWFCGTPDLHIV